MGTPTGAAARGEQPTVGQEGWGSWCPQGQVWNSAQRVSPVLQSCAGAALGDLQPVGGPHGISLGKTVSREKGHMEQGRRVTVEEQQRQSIKE